jgi:leucyl aminopeptidase (aminopeptidase T)
MITLTNASTILKNLSPSEYKAGTVVMRDCMAVRSDESVLIVTDDKAIDEAAIFFEAAKQFTKNVTLITMPAGTEHAQEPLPEVASLMKQYTVALLVTTCSLSHTQARKAACVAGTRIASMPTITHEMILRTLPIDYTEIAELSTQVATLQTAGSAVHITSPRGTDLQFSINGRTAIADTGVLNNSGDFGNLPAGEAFIAPVEGTANGTIVFDGCFADIKLDQPITVIVKNGHATDITGGEAARVLVNKLAAVGKDGYNIAEFGIGTNKTARLNDNLLEVEKVYGTCHIALGNNATFGGEVDVPFHSDGVILKPTIEIDNKQVIKSGRFLI